MYREKRVNLISDSKNKFTRFRLLYKKAILDKKKKFRPLDRLSATEIGVTDWTKIFYSLLIGMVCGLIGVFFKYSVNLLARASYLGSLGEESAFRTLPGWSILVFLPLAALLASWIVYRYAPDASGTGSAAYIAAFHHKNAVIRPSVPIVKFFASTLNLGFGASGGFEGPIVLMGAGAGSWIAGKIKKIRDDAHIYMVTGVAAGIGAVFLAPLGGALTAIEMLYREDYETRALVPSLLASVTGYFVASFFDPSGFAVKNLVYTFNGICEIPSYILFTFLCSASGWLFVKAFDNIREFCSKSSLPPYLFPFFGAVITALMALLFPIVLGPRLSVLVDVIEAHPGVIIVAMFIIAKMAATTLFIAPGGSGGIFGPALIIGGLLGIAFSRFLTWTGFSLPVPDPQSMMLVGMAAFFAAISKAPFGSVIMVCEIGGTFALLPPLLIVCLTTIVMTKNFTIYKSQVDNRFKSPAHSRRLIEEALSGKSAGASRNNGQS